MKHAFSHTALTMYVITNCQLHVQCIDCSCTKKLQFSVPFPPLGFYNDTQLIENLVWNLRTWPLELVEWPTANSHRLDIRFNPEQDRYACTNYIAVL